LIVQQTTNRTTPQVFGRVAPFLLLVGVGVAGCGPTYSPNTYSSTAVQQANKVDQAVVVGVRQVDISAQTTVGTVTGGGVGGIAGSTAGDGIGSALGALGGTVLGGIVGSTVEHTTSDTQGYEYIVRKTNGDLLSVTQKDATPLAIGAHVLIIAGNQARIVPDYTVTVEGEKPAAKSAETAPDAKPPVAANEKPPVAANEPNPPVAANEPELPVAANEPKPPVAANEPNPPVAANEPEPPQTEPEAASAAAHVAITETPLPKIEASPPAPQSAAEPPKAEPAPAP
jgi:outer membrane lipoprotein SlyB